MQSAVEVAKLIHDAIEALFDMDLPLPPEIMNMLMEGIDSGLQRQVLT